MKISVERLLDKIENETRAARAAESSTKVKQHMQTVKALTELILESEDENELKGFDYGMPHQQSDAQRSIVHQQIEQPTIQKQEQKLEEADANGDSLLDF